MIMDSRIPIEAERRKEFKAKFKINDLVVPYAGTHAYVRITAMGEWKFLGKRIGDRQERAYSMGAYPWELYEIK